MASELSEEQLKAARVALINGGEALDHDQRWRLLEALNEHAAQAHRRA